MTKENETKVQDKSTNKEINDLLKGYSENANVHTDNNDSAPIQDDPPKKRKRGRPRKDEKQEPVEPPQAEIQASDYINGAMFILLIDLLLPNVIAFGNNKLTKKKIKASKMQMTDKQRSDLQPLADEVAKHLLVNVSPITLFVISLVGIYGINFMMLKAE